ncbi:hypothetical protein FPV67DRAFT_1472311 [Lyophyllum atratum]|nr:hypothetical protein FPV67DRAFT_1472311 [Lyophyllum atratum]
MSEFNPPHRQSAIIGTPQSRRSGQQATPPAFQAPAVPGEQYVVTPAGALHAPDSDAFNVDPNSPYLDTAGSRPDTNPAPTSARSDNKRFVGGFVAAVKKAVRQQGSSQMQPHPEEGRPLARGHNPEQNYGGSPPPAAAEYHSGSVHAHPMPSANSSPVASSSHTAHESIETGTHDDDITAVEHERVPVGEVIGSPVYVEPQPGSDYAKMDSPRRSITSLASYASRIQKFFRDLNDLPWVAERVTVDYVPGESKGRRQARERRAQRPTSWYGNIPNALPGHHNIDLFSETTSPTSLPRTHQDTRQPTLPYSAQREVIFRIQSPNEQTQNIPYVSVVPASYTLTPPAAPVPHDRPRATHHTPSTAGQTPTQSQPTPEPLPAATPAQSPVPVFRPYGETYPMGYVPYQQQAAVAEQYNGLSHHNMSQVPARAVSSTSGTTTHPSRPVSTQATQPSRPASNAATPRLHRPASMQYPYPVTTPA